jgi:HAMP domain-containing protein
MVPGGHGHAAMITVLGAAYLFIRRTLKPLHTLKAGVNTVGAGKLEHRIPETGRQRTA